MYQIVYKGIRGKRSVARFETVEKAREWVDHRLSIGLPIVNPQITKES